MSRILPEFRVNYYKPDRAHFSKSVPAWDMAEARTIAVEQDEDSAKYDRFTITRRIGSGTWVEVESAPTAQEDTMSTNVEHVEILSDDAWRCLCGNEPQFDGFYPCDACGREVDPQTDDWDNERLVCARCGRIIHLKTGEVLGRACCEECGGPTTADMPICTSCLTPSALRHRPYRAEAAMDEHMRWRSFWRKMQDEYWQHTRTLVVGAALALALIAAPASAKLTDDEGSAIRNALAPLVPAGCVLQRVYEDYTGEAVCAGSYLLWVNGQDGTSDIPYAAGTITVGPDANGVYWDWPVYD